MFLLCFLFLGVSLFACFYLFCFCLVLFYFLLFFVCFCFCFLFLFRRDGEEILKMMNKRILEYEEQSSRSIPISSGSRRCKPRNDSCVSIQRFIAWRHCVLSHVTRYAWFDVLYKWCNFIQKFTWERGFLGP